MLIKKDMFEINVKFLKTFSQRWLKTSEIYLLLLNAEKLIETQLIKLSEEYINIESKPGNFYFIKEKLFKNKNEFFKRNIIKFQRNRTKLKFDGIDVNLNKNKINNVNLGCRMLV
jgi:hypothetical protein